ncbi:MAG TPA: hydrogenase small subunit [Thermodesulfobacteriota bacterium]|nr:hydrogenase small subunit [Thermodesulfobacteriota bacterium]
MGRDLPVKNYSGKGVSRREFLKFCSMVAATLALPSSMVPRIAEALEKREKPVLVWLEFQDCAGDTESTLRATKPTLGQLVLDVFSLEYHETLMAAAGHQSEKSLADVVRNQKGKYITVVEGAIPLKDGGIYCTVGGKAAVDIAREVCGNAVATIAVGNCAAFGGIAAAHPNPTGAVGVHEAVTGITLVNLPGCPMNVENLTATIIHYLTFGSPPAVDSLRRPLFAYGKRIHDNCERRAHFDAGQFVRSWGDEGHRLGWCLYEMGCKGPMAYQNCPTIKWNGGTSWPIQAGHGCIACGTPNNWDTAYPFYRRLPNVPGANVQVAADKIGVGLVAATLVGISAHLVGREIRKAATRKRPSDDKEAKGEEKIKRI